MARDLEDFKMKLALGKTPIVYLNQAADYPQWEVGLRRLVATYRMADSLLYSMPAEEANEFAKTVADGKVQEGTKKLTAEFLNAVGVSAAQEDFFSSSTVFINTRTGREESASEGYFRTDIWAWMEQSLAKGVYKSLIKNIRPIYDIRKLYLKVTSIANKATIISHALEFKKVFTIESRGDIFQYYSELQQQIKILHAQAEALNLKTEFPAWMEEALLLIAAWQDPVYRKIALDYSMQDKKFTADVLLGELHKQQLLTAHLGDGGEQTGQEIKAKVARETYPKYCYGFQKDKCSRKDCPFLHEKRPAGAGASVSGKFKKLKCNHCKKNGHTEATCRAKTNSKSKEMGMAKRLDGFLDDAGTVSRVLVAQDTVGEILTQETPIVKQVISATRWCIDSGANRDICNERGLFEKDFVSKAIKIGEAGTGHSFLAEGEGSIKVQGKEGTIPMFNKAIYATQVNENILSVSEAIDNGFDVVFSKNGVGFYNQPLQIQAQPVLRGARDMSNRLFYISFPIPNCKQAKSVEADQSFILEWRARRAELKDDDAPGEQASLARTYHEILSEKDLWHPRLAHVNPRLMELAIPGLKGEKSNCDDCTRGKMHKHPHSGKRPEAKDLPYEPGEYVSCDLFGPVVASKGGARYVAFYIDARSRYVYVKFLKHKDDQYSALLEVISDMKARSGNALRFMKTDGDGIFTGKRALKIYQDYAVRHIQSAPGDSASNDIAERTIRTFAELTTTNLLHANAPTYLWAEAMAMVAHVWNRLPVMGTKNGKILSRMAILEGHSRLYDLGVMRAFGTKCHYLLTLQKKGGLKQALNEKARLGVILCMEDNMPAYKVMDMQSRRILKIPFAQITTHEGHYPFKNYSNWVEEEKLLPVHFMPIAEAETVKDEWESYRFSELEIAASPARDTNMQNIPSPDVPAVLPNAGMENQPTTQPPTAPMDADFEMVENEAKEEAEQVFTPTRNYELRQRKHVDYRPEPQLHRKNEANKQPWKAMTLDAQDMESEQSEDDVMMMDGGAEVNPDKCLSSILNYVKVEAKQAKLAAKEQVQCVSHDPKSKPTSIPAPRNRKEALQSLWWDGYYQAELTEMKSHHANGTWKLVPPEQVPANCTVLKDRWAYDDKIGEDGKIERFKARLTAMGCFQKAGVDYYDTYASVMNTRTFRVMLKIYNDDREAEMLHWDVSTAFIHAPLQEKVYMRQASGHIVKGKETWVYLLVKALYGTKQAARAWQLHLRSILIEADLQPMQNDPATYVWRRDDSYLIVGTHVDDIFVLFNKKGEMAKNKLWQVVSKHLTIKNLGQAKWTLQMSIQRDIEAGTLTLSQASFTREVLRRFNMSHCKSQPTPAIDYGKEAVMTDEDIPTEEHELKEIADLPFLELIGCLWWLAQMTRPDIYVALQQASKWTSKPSMKLWRWLTRILRYLAGTTTLGLAFRRSTEPISLQAYFDASFANEPNAKSTAGYIIYMGNATIAYDSSSVKRVVLSSTEAECNALVTLWKELTWLRRMIMEVYGLKQLEPTLVSGDNTATLALLNSGVSRRSRYFTIEWFKIKEAIEDKEIDVQWVATDKNTADFFTKKLSKLNFERHRGSIMGCTDNESSTDKEPNIARCLKDTCECQPDEAQLQYELALNQDLQIMSTGEEIWTRTAIAAPIPVIEEAKQAFPHLNLVINGKVTMAKHKSENSKRMDMTREMMKFILAYVATLNEAMKNEDGSTWLLLADGEVSHLPLSCGWAATKYGQANNPILTWRRVKRSDRLPQIGTPRCGCQRLLEDNPDILFQNSPMIATGRYALTHINHALETIKREDRKKFSFNVVEWQGEMAKLKAMGTDVSSKSAEANAECNTTPKKPIADDLEQKALTPMSIDKKRSASSMDATQLQGNLQLFKEWAKQQHVGLVVSYSELEMNNDTARTLQKMATELQEAAKIAMDQAGKMQQAIIMHYSRRCDRDRDPNGIA